MNKLKIEWLYDEYDCETCGTNWADGANVYYGKELVLSFEPVAHCYSGNNYTEEFIYKKIIEWLCSKFGFGIEGLTMNKERDKFLTEAMGECWHNDFPECQNDSYTKCKKCGVYGPYPIESFVDYSTWEGFGKLIDWCKSEDDWFCDFLEMQGGSIFMINVMHIEPDYFANSVYEYLKENKD